MALLTYEIKLVAHYIQQSETERAKIFKEAQANPRLSGDLIRAYLTVEQIL